MKKTKKYLTFKRSISQTAKNKLLNIFQSIFHRNNPNGGIELSEGYWRESGLQELYTVIHQLNSVGLNLSQNANKSMFLQIKDIRFSQLLFLNLCDNGIDSMESIGQLYAPLLFSLKISDNNITQLAPFRKSRFQKLGIFDVTAGNRVTELKYLREFHFPELSRVQLDLPTQKNIANDIANFCALETKSLILLNMQSTIRIKYQQCKRQIGLKYIGVMIY